MKKAVPFIGRHQNPRGEPDGQRDGSGVARGTRLGPSRCPERAALGTTVPNREPTPVGPPATRPVLQADTSQRLKTGIAFADEGTPAREAKPARVIGCEAWVKIGGTPPTNMDDRAFLGFDTRTPDTANFDGPQGGQTAHFIGVWVNGKGERGPLSQTVSATIPG